MEADQIHLENTPWVQDPADTARSEVTEIVFKFTRSRLIHGRTPQFIEDRSRLHFEGDGGKDKDLSGFLQKTLLEKTNITEAVPHSTGVNTNRAEPKTTGLWHKEGGWQKEINPHDMDLLERTKKKMQKEESYMETIPLIVKEAEVLVRQNNTIQMSDSCDKVNTKSIFFKRDLTPFANVVSVYRCPSQRKRPVSKIRFSPDGKGRLAVTYCPYEFDPTLRDQTCEAFFWETEIPTRPESMVRASSQITDLSFHPKDVNNICGSLFTGQVAKWDIRVGPNPQSVSTFDVSHDDVATSAMWINSKSGFEFFSCSLDGTVVWWDVRNLGQRLDVLYADPEKGRGDPSQVLPVTVLDYEHSLPTKFIVGTQSGQVMIFMRKGKTPEERLSNAYTAHKGPVRSIHRNPVFIKNFMSCGDYHLRIFAEDCRDSGIIWTAPSEFLYTYANWLPGRPCGLVASRTDGCLEFWDLLNQGVTSVLETKVSEEILSTVCPSDGGTHVAAGTVDGDIRLVQLSPSLQTFDKTDKSALSMCMERESKREKYLEQRNREMRLVAKRQREAKQKESLREIDISEKESSASESEASQVLSSQELVGDKRLFERLADEKKLENPKKGKEKLGKVKSMTIKHDEERKDGDGEMLVPRTDCARRDNFNEQIVYNSTVILPF